MPQAALLRVYGGPRTGNVRSAFFWMDLKSGKVVRFPDRWGLDCFSADGRVAVFTKPAEKEFTRGPRQAVEMRTGERIDALPVPGKERCIPFHFQNTPKVMALSVDGLVLPDALAAENLSMARADGDFAGFRLRVGNGEPSTLCIVPFKDPKKTESIATDVIDFAMLGQGNLVFVTAHKYQYAETFFYARADKSSWNVLEGVERLPKLSNPDAGDLLTVRLIEGFGTSRHEPLVVCLFEHTQGPLRANYVPPEKAIKLAQWRRTLLITHDGQRFLAPLTHLFGEGKTPAKIWLHKSGKLITGTYVWHDSELGGRLRVQLSERTLQTPTKPANRDAPPAD